MMQRRKLEIIIPNENLHNEYSYPNIITVFHLKVNLSLYRLWRPLGLREVEAPTFSDIRLTDGGKTVSF
jgi:hypothetical protein